jgi:glycosyltransferase involved in cell wall biosynthesis
MHPMSAPPRITLAVVAYNQSTLIEATVRSALTQQCEPIEILLSDDASTDDTFEKMQALAAAYAGPHQVVLRRNARNLGTGPHSCEVYRAAHGQLIVLMAGDDISTPDRVARTAAAWDASGQKLDLIACHLFDMAYDGQTLGTLRVDDLSQWATLADWARRPPYIVGAGHACTRRLFERFGPMAADVVYEDQVNVLRALMSGGACTIDAPLVHYRRGGISASLQEFSAQGLLDWRRRLNNRHMTMITQWLADAKIAGHESTVQAAITDLFKDEFFWQSLLRAATFKARYSAVRSHPELPLAWRLRKLIYISVPGIAAQIRRWQFARKQRRHGTSR